MSRLEDISLQFREQNLGRNTYAKEDYYNPNHPNAKSDGDEKGKGLDGGTVGSATDISKRQELATKNIYNRNNPYNIDNA